MKNETEARKAQIAKKIVCDIPFCEEYVSNYYCFDQKSIKCMSCGKGMCEDCCSKIWKGEWNGEQFYKPKIIIQGLKHEVFMCPFCRASFDRIVQVDEN